MDLRGDQCGRAARAPAKLNLFLDVLGRRADGFHELETLMVPLRFADQVCLTPTAAPSTGEPAPIELKIQSCWLGRSPPNDVVPQGSENVVLQALELLRVRSGCTFGARVQLIKRIPM